MEKVDSLSSLVWSVVLDHTRHESESTLSAASRTVQPHSGKAAAQLCRPSPAGVHSLNFGRSFSASVIISSDELLCVFGAVKTQQSRLAFEERFQMNRATPDVLYVGESVSRFIQ